MAETDGGRQLDVRRTRSGLPAARQLRPGIAACACGDPNKEARRVRTGASLSRQKSSAFDHDRFVRRESKPAQGRFARVAAGVAAEQDSSRWDFDFARLVGEVQRYHRPAGWGFANKGQTIFGCLL